MLVGIHEGYLQIFRIPVKEIDAAFDCRQFFVVYSIIGNDGRK
jgi:hypothetical protein